MKLLGHCLLRLLVSLLSGFVAFAFIRNIGIELQITSYGFLILLLFLLFLFAVPLLIAFLVFVFLPRPSESETASDSLTTADDIVVTSKEDLRIFLDSHSLVNRINTKVVGVTFNNDDGTSRQEALSLCRGGNEISLMPFEFRGSPAYAVYSPYGQIGNLSADLAKTIDSKYDGCIIHGTITARTGGYSGYPYGCNILLEVYRPISSAIDTKSNITVNEKKTVDESFIAEAQWYAARGGTDLTDDE